MGEQKRHPQSRSAEGREDKEDSPLFLRKKGENAKIPIVTFMKKRNAKGGPFPRLAAKSSGEKKKKRGGVWEKKKKRGKGKL